MGKTICLPRRGVGGGGGRENGGGRDNSVQRLLSNGSRRTDGRTDGRTKDGWTDEYGQTYIPPPSASDNKI